MSVETRDVTRSAADLPYSWAADLKLIERIENVFGIKCSDAAS